MIDFRQILARMLATHVQKAGMPPCGVRTGLTDKDYQHYAQIKWKERVAHFKEQKRLTGVEMNPGDKKTFIEFESRTMKEIFREEGIGALPPDFLSKLPKAGRLAKPGLKTTPPEITLVKPVSVSQKYATQGAWEKNLVGRQKNAFEGWSTSSNFQNIRNLDIGDIGKILPKELELAKVYHKDILTAINSAPVPKETVMRGMHGLSKAQVNKFTKVGDRLDFNSLSSWTSDKSVVRTFTGPVGAKDEGVVFIMQPKTRGASIQNLVAKQYKEEREFLMPKGSYRVESVTRSRLGGEDFYRVVRLVEI